MYVLRLCTAGNWFYINVAELAAAAGLPPEAPLVEVVTGGWLVGRVPWAWLGG
jgi:hypothetical protein